MGSPNSFNQAQALLAQYWYEAVPYTWGPGTLANGITSIFSALNWTPANAPVWQARLLGAWATQSASVQASWKGDGINYNAAGTQGYTDAAPQAPLYFTGSVYGMGRIRAYAPAIGNLSMSANNSSGAGINSFNLNYLVGMKRLTVAEKVLWAGVAGQQPPYSITTQDLAYIAALPLHGFAAPLDRIRAQVEAGMAPVSIEKELAALHGLRLGDDPGSGLFHVTATTTSGSIPFARSTANPGEFLVLEELAAEGGTTGVGDFEIYGDRDQNAGYITVSADAYQFANDVPPQPIVPALDYWQFRADTTSGSVTNAPVRVRVGRYRLTDAWLCRLQPVRALADSISHPGQPVDPALFATVQAGI